MRPAGRPAVAETLIDVTFPVGGVEVAHAYSAPPPRTTPTGRNVRGYEPLTNRARGGSRPGLARYLPSPDGTESPIQHLNYIVDPAGVAIYHDVDIQLGDFTTDFVFIPWDIDLTFDPVDALGPPPWGYFVPEGGDLFQPPPRRTRNAVRIVWNDPADILVGTALSGTQLNAVALDAADGSSVLGGFVYTPPSGTVMNILGRQTLSTLFTPFNDLKYRRASRSVHVNVTKRALTITADDQSKDQGVEFVFDGTEFTTSMLQPGDSVTSCTLACDGAPADAPDGDYPITPSAAVGVGLQNYDITYVPGVMTVGAPGWDFVGSAGVSQFSSYHYAGGGWPDAGWVTPPGAPSVTLSGVQAGDLLVVPVWRNVTALGASLALSDSRGNGYVRVGMAQAFGSSSFLELWYAVANATGSVTVLLTLTPGAPPSLPYYEYCHLAALAYRTPSGAPVPPLPLGSYSQGQGTSTVASTGGVTSSNPHALVIAMFASADPPGDVLLSGYVWRINLGILDVADSLNTPAGVEAVTLTYTASTIWIATGASFLSS